MKNFDDLPLGAIVGYVDIKDIKDETYEDSVWAQGAPCQWLLENAYIFDEPNCDIYDFDRLN